MDWVTLGKVSSTVMSYSLLPFALALVSKDVIPKVLHCLFASKFLFHPKCFVTISFKYGRSLVDQSS